MARLLLDTWVATSLSGHVEFERRSSGAVGYGYWWWVLPPDPDVEGKQDIYGAFGFKGQYIFLVPEHDTTAPSKNKAPFCETRA